MGGRSAALEESSHLLRMLPLRSLPEHPARVHSCPRPGFHAHTRPCPADKFRGGLGREGLPHAEGSLTVWGRFDGNSTSLNCIWQDNGSLFASPKART